MTKTGFKESLKHFSAEQKQCFAIIFLERFCAKHKINSPEVVRKIDHLWHLTTVCPDTYAKWLEGFYSLAILDSSKPFHPQKITKAIPSECIEDFNSILQSVLQTVFAGLDGLCPNSLKEGILTTLEIASRNDVEIPNTDLYSEVPITRWRQFAAKELRSMITPQDLLEFSKPAKKKKRRHHGNIGS